MIESGMAASRAEFARAGGLPPLVKGKKETTLQRSEGRLCCESRMTADGYRTPGNPSPSAFRI